MEAEGLSTSRWPAATLVARRHASHIERGQRVALIGRNGAGKTTLAGDAAGPPRRPSAAAPSSATTSMLAYYSQQSLELPEQARLVDAVAARHAS